MTISFSFFFLCVFLSVNVCVRVAIWQSHDVPTPGAEASPAESTSTTASSTSSSNNNRRLTAKAATGTVKQKNNKKFKGDQ